MGSALYPCYDYQRTAADIIRTYSQCAVSLLLNRGLSMSQTGRRARRGRPLNEMELRGVASAIYQ